MNRKPPYTRQPGAPKGDNQQYQGTLSSGIQANASNHGTRMSANAKGEESAGKVIESWMRYAASPEERREAWERFREERAESRRERKEASDKSTWENVALAGLGCLAGLAAGIGTAYAGAQMMKK